MGYRPGTRRRLPLRGLPGSPVSSWLNFTPASLNPSAWYDASDTASITSSGSPALVSQWDDKSGNGLHVAQGTSANQPTTGSTTRNNLNVLSFSGNQTLFLNSVTGFSTGSSSIFAVFSHGGTPGMILDTRGANDNPIWCIEGFAGVSFGRRRNDANSIASTAGSNVQGFQFASVTFDGSVVTYRRNGVQIGTANNSGVATFTNIRIGARKNPLLVPISQFHRGTIAEIVVLPTAITYERLLMEEYFRVKYGIPKLA